MEVDVGRDIADLRAVDRDLVGEHARRRDLDRVRPVVVVVAERVGEVEDRVLGDLGVVLRHVEVGRLDGALSNGMRDEEEVELAVDDLGLLDEAVVDVGALRRVGDVLATVAAAAAVVVTASAAIAAVVLLLVLDLEEPLSDALVDDDEGGLRQLGCLLLLRAVRAESVLLADDLVQLLELVLDDLGAHGVADAVTVDDDVVRQGAAIVVSEGLEGVLEVLREDAAADDFLAFLPLGAGLGVVLTHVLVVGGTEADD